MGWEGVILWRMARRKCVCVCVCVCVCGFNVCIRVGVEGQRIICWWAMGLVVDCILLSALCV